MSDVKKVYEEYWQSKIGLEDFENYERNQALSQFIKPGDQVLDLASGEGSVGEFMKKLGAKVTAFDISEKALAKAKQRGLVVKLGDVEKKLPFADNIFDTVFWGDNVEHLFLPEKTLKEVHRVLKKSGKIIVSCPNMGYWRYRLEYLFRGMVPKTEWYREKSWEWEHIRFFNKAVMNEFLSSNGFRVNSFIGVSRRRLDKLVKMLSPELGGMIMIVEGVKK